MGKRRWTTYWGLRMPLSVYLALLSSSSGLEQNCSLYFALLCRVQSLNHAGSKSSRSKSSRFKHLWILEQKFCLGADPSYSSHEWLGFCCSPQQDFREGESINVIHVDPSVHPPSASHKTVKTLNSSFWWWQPPGASTVLLDSSLVVGWSSQINVYWHQVDHRCCLDGRHRFSADWETS